MENRKQALIVCVGKTGVDCIVSWSVGRLGQEEKKNQCCRKGEDVVGFLQPGQDNQGSFNNKLGHGNTDMQSTTTGRLAGGGTTISTGGEGRYEDVLVINID